ncbi:hypothetical protein Tco_1262322 [Tanacetum coccineum]
MATNEETNAAGTDTRPPYVGLKIDYESWKIRYTRKKLDSEFNEEEKKLEMSDTQAEIILSQGLPRHIFNILNQTSTAKDYFMVIDKSWTSLGKHEKAFYTGLKKFVDDCKPLVDSAGNIRCLCKSCRLVLWVSIKHLSDYISKYGFDPSYKTWIHHGEPDLPPPPPVIDNTRQPQMSDMTACLNDLSYIPLNNEQNEPTQEDIGETSNDPTQAKRNEFEELYASANEEMYPGCITLVNRLGLYGQVYLFLRLKVN